MRAAESCSPLSIMEGKAGGGSVSAGEGTPQSQQEQSFPAASERKEGEAFSLRSVHGGYKPQSDDVDEDDEVFLPDPVIANTRCIADSGESHRNFSFPSQENKLSSSSGEKDEIEEELEGDLDLTSDSDSQMAGYAVGGCASESDEDSEAVNILFVAPTLTPRGQSRDNDEEDSLGPSTKGGIDDDEEDIIGPSTKRGIDDDDDDRESLDSEDQPPLVSRLPQVPPHRPSRESERVEGIYDSSFGYSGDRLEAGVSLPGNSDGVNNVQSTGEGSWDKAGEMARQGEHQEEDPGEEEGDDAGVAHGGPLEAACELEDPEKIVGVCEILPCLEEDIKSNRSDISNDIGKECDPEVEHGGPLEATDGLTDSDRVVESGAVFGYLEGDAKDSILMRNDSDEGLDTENRQCCSQVEPLSPMDERRLGSQSDAQSGQDGAAAGAGKLAMKYAFTSLENYGGYGTIGEAVPLIGNVNNKLQF